ncbi:MAG: TolC family protein [Planctomycetota bacterium]|jgi:hypothetical protein
MRLFLVFLIAAGCAHYKAQPVEWEAVSATIAARAPGALEFEAALAHAREHNPELKRMRAEAEAAGFDVPPTYLNLSANTAESKALGFVDPVALLKLGPRGARARAAKERETAMMAELRQRDLEVAAAIAEAYLVERILRDLELPKVDADPALFAQAGLASEAERMRVAYAREKERAEREIVAALRLDNRARLLRLLGAGPNASLEVIVPEEAEFPPLPEAGDLMARPDLAVAFGRYQVADAEFRAAVLDQYPVIAVGPVFSWDLMRWGMLFPTRIPVGAAGPARAAGKRREAARLAVEEALLDAQEDAARRRAQFDRWSAQDRAAKSGARMAAADLRAAIVHIEISPDAFGHVARAAPDAVERMVRARTVSLAAARARVDLARAYAWPHTATRAEADR